MSKSNEENFPMERPQLEEHVLQREVELQEALPNAFSRIWDLYLPEPIRLDSPDIAGDLLRIQVVREKLSLGKR